MSNVSWIEPTGNVDFCAVTIPPPFRPSIPRDDGLMHACSGNNSKHGAEEAKPTPSPLIMGNLHNSKSRKRRVGCLCRDDGRAGLLFAKCNLLQITDYLIEILICDIIYIILSKY